MRGFIWHLKKKREKKKKKEAELEEKQQWNLLEGEDLEYLTLEIILMHWNETNMATEIKDK